MDPSRSSSGRTSDRKGEQSDLTKTRRVSESESDKLKYNQGKNPTQGPDASPVPGGEDFQTDVQNGTRGIGMSSGSKRYYKKSENSTPEPMDVSPEGGASYQTERENENEKYDNQFQNPAQGSVRTPSDLPASAEKRKFQTDQQTEKKQVKQFSQSMYSGDQRGKAAEEQKKMAESYAAEGARPKTASNQSKPPTSQISSSRPPETRSSLQDEAPSTQSGPPPSPSAPPEPPSEAGPYPEGLPAQGAASNQSKPPTSQISSSRPPETRSSLQNEAPGTQSGPPSSPSAPPEPPSEAGPWPEGLPAQGAGLYNFLETIWQSRNTTMNRKNSVKLSSFQKWCFLLENTQQHNKIICRLKEINTDIDHKIEKTGIRITFYCGTPFKGEEEDEHCEELNLWKKECSRILKEIFEDILIVTIGCRFENMDVIRDFLVKKFSRTVDIIESKDCHGICLVGDGKSLIAVISEIRGMESFKETILWDPETKLEKEVGVIGLGLIQRRFWNHLDLEKRTKDQFKSVKTYMASSGKLLTLIGNKDDVGQMKDYLRNKTWLHLYPHRAKGFDEEFLEFLRQETVEKFLDDKIKKTAVGTWVISDEKKSLVILCLEDKNIEKIFEMLHQSIRREKFQIPDSLLYQVQERAEKLREQMQGRFCMHSGLALNKTFRKGVTEVCFLYTTDLLNNEEVVNLVDEIRHEAEKNTNVIEHSLKFSPEVFQYLWEMKNSEILGPKQDVCVEFKEEESTMVLKGDKDAVLAVEDYVIGLKVEQRSVFLPQSLTNNQIPEKLCETLHCNLSKLQSNQESRVWLKNNFVVMVYLGEPRRNLSIDSQVVLEFSSGDAKSECRLRSPTDDFGVFTITIPKIHDGKGKHSARDSFEEAFNKMLAFKRKRVLIPLKIEGTWSTKKLVKSILYPVTRLVPQDVITVILSSSDQNRCAEVNKTIQEVFQETKKKDQPSRIEFEVKKSNITKEKVDVIVNTTSSDLDLTFGAVSSSIFKAANKGSDLQRELKRKNNFKTSVEYGELLETESYGLACQKIFHGALKPWDSTRKDLSSEKIMQTFVTSCLEKANKHRFSTLAFPALGTGNLGFPPDVVAKLIKETVRKFEDGNPNQSVRRIIFIIYHKDDEIFKKFKDIYKETENEDNTVTKGIGLEEIVVCGHEDNVKSVVEELHQQLQVECFNRLTASGTNFNPKSMKASLKEPESQEMTDRDGTESSEAGAGADLTPKEKPNPANKDTTDLLDDTSHCKIARFTEKKAMEDLFVLLKLEPRAVICPYEKENEALVIFNSWDDADKFFKNSGHQLEVRNIEQQAVRNVEAQISTKCMELFTNLKVFEDNLVKCSGVLIIKSDKRGWILCGNLQQIELAHNCIKEMISCLTEREADLTSTEQENPKSSTATSSPVEEENDEKCTSIRMSKKDYVRYITLFQLDEGGGNIRYSNENQSVHVSGSKSFVESAKRQLTSKMIAREIDITEDIYKEMETDIRQLNQGNSPIAVCRAKDGKMEVLGMSEAAVEDVVKSLERKRDYINECKRKVHANDHFFCTNEGLEIKIYQGNIRKLDVNCLIEFTKAKELEQGARKKTGKSQSTKKEVEGHCYYTSRGKEPDKSGIQVCLPNRSSEFDAQIANSMKYLVLEALKLAEGQRIKSIGIPLCTVLHYPDTQTCAEIYASAIIEFSSKHQKAQRPMEIHIIDEVETNVECIAKVFDNAFKESANQFLSKLPVKSAPKTFLPTLNIAKPNQIEYQLQPNFKVSVYRGEILHSDVDAICCGQDSLFQSKGHIAKIITDASKNVKEWLFKEKEKRHQIGDTVMIECKIYSAQYIIFVVNKDASHKESPGESLRTIKTCFLEVLKFANGKNIRKLALPLFGTGDKRLSRKEIACLFVESIKEFLKSSKGFINLREVHCVNHDKQWVNTVQDNFFDYVTGFTHFDTQL